MTGPGKGLQPEGIQPGVWRYEGKIHPTNKCSTTGCYRAGEHRFRNTKSFNDFKWKTLRTHTFCPRCVDRMNKFLRKQIPGRSAE